MNDLDRSSEETSWIHEQAKHEMQRKQQNS